MRNITIKFMDTGMPAQNKERLPEKESTQARRRRLLRELERRGVEADLADLFVAEYYNGDRGQTIQQVEFKVLSADDVLGKAAELRTLVDRLTNEPDAWRDDAMLEHMVDLAKVAGDIREQAKKQAERKALAKKVKPEVDRPKRPEQIAEWKEEDYFTARAEGDPRLADAAALLGRRDKLVGRLERLIEERGEAVVQKNYAAVDASLAHLKEVKLDGRKADSKISRRSPDQVPQVVLRSLRQNKGFFIARRYCGVFRRTEDRADVAAGAAGSF